MSQLHWIAEQIHRVSDDLPLPVSLYTRTDDLDELDARLRDLAGLLTRTSTAAAYADQTAASDALQRSKTTVLTQAVGTLTRAMTHLSGAIVQAGLLHQADAEPRSAERTAAQRSAHSLIGQQIDATRAVLNQTGHDLHRAADRLFGLSPATTPPVPPPHPGTPHPPSPRAR